MKIGTIHIHLNGEDVTLISTDQYAEVTYEDVVMLAGKQGTDYNIVYDNRRMLGGGTMEQPGDTATFYDGAHVYVYPGP